VKSKIEDPDKMTKYKVYIYFIDVFVCKIFLLS